MVNRINKLGKAGQIIAVILRVLLIIAFIGVLLGLIVVTALPTNLVTVDVGSDVGVQVDISDFAKLDEEQQQEVREGLKEFADENDGTDYEVTETAIKLKFKQKQGVYGIKDAIGPIVVTLLYIASSYVILWFVGLLCKAFRNCESPFDDLVIKRMKNFAICLIVWMALSLVLNFVFSTVFLSELNIHMGFSLGTVLLGLVVLGLCGIFRYGASLQKEHDETL